MCAILSAYKQMIQYTITAYINHIYKRIQQKKDSLVENL